MADNQRDKDADVEDGLGAGQVTPNGLPHVKSNDNLIEDDPWALADEVDTGPAWEELTTSQRIKRVALVFLKIIFVLGFLYFFICSLDLLSSAFRLIGGRAAGEVLRNNELLNNPVCGLVVGVMVTVLVQSSSTSTSIVVAMVASRLLSVRTAIPIVMGANIGTSVTNTIVSMSMVADRNQFRRAFGGATVHDMFNWLCVFVLLPIEVATGYLFHLTNAIINSMNLNAKGAKVEFLKVITTPFTKLIIQLDKKVLEKISTGDDSGDESLLKYWCKEGKRLEPRNLTFSGPINMTAVNLTVGGNDYIVKESTDGGIVMWNITVKYGIEKCKYLFSDTGLPEAAVGAILLVLSLALLCLCLMGMVKLLQALLKGQVASVIRKTINSDFPGPFRYLTGYVAILVGAGMTILVQSSSVFTSTLTPLVGAGIVTLDRVYPLTLGSNIGTTATSILASLASSSDTIQYTLQIAFCHLFFNISGILIFYPLPLMRKIPINLAKKLGNTTAKYRWFAVFYLVAMFFLLPLFVFALSLAGWEVLLGVGGPILLLIVFIVIINIIQSKCPGCLPRKLQSWEWLPLWCRSLQPIDDLIVRSCGCCKCCRPQEKELPENSPPYEAELKPDMPVTYINEGFEIIEKPAMTDGHDNKSFENTKF